MLENERIKEAETNVRGYLHENLIKKENFKPIVYDTYMRNHRESLLLAKKIFEEKSSCLWTIVISYYSMFYIANAILYKLGYKIGSKVAHKVTSDALIIFVRNKIKDQLIEDYDLASSEALQISDNLLQSYDLELGKRSRFQYEFTEEIKIAKAETSLKRAQEFSKEMEKLLF